MTAWKLLEHVVQTTPLQVVQHSMKARLCIPRCLAPSVQGYDYEASSHKTPDPRFQPQSDKGFQSCRLNLKGRYRHAVTLNPNGRIACPLFQPSAIRHAVSFIARSGRGQRYVSFRWHQG